MIDVNWIEWETAGKIMRKSSYANIRKKCRCKNWMENHGNIIRKSAIIIYLLFVFVFSPPLSIFGIEWGYQRGYHGDINQQIRLEFWLCSCGFGGNKV